VDKWVANVKSTPLAISKGTSMADFLGMMKQAAQLQSKLQSMQE
jgi:hypothetical protein